MPDPWDSESSGLFGISKSWSHADPNSVLIPTATEIFSLAPHLAGVNTGMGPFGPSWTAIAMMGGDRGDLASWTL